jgi:phosphatidylethanolamine/phosphatidyl-N-methylethanolamine N-methyltransferase
MRIKHSRVFYKSAARDFKQTGAVAPSSRALGRAMTSEIVRHYKNPATVLEVGGGTGCITEVIARCIKEGDRLDVYEIDAEFSSLLNRRVKEDRPFQHIRTSVCIYNQPIEKIDRRARYDFIVSCLPFTNFLPGMVREIFEIYRDLLRPGGVASFFEYILLREAGQLVRSEAERRRISGVARVVGEYVGLYGYKRDLVFFNIPPAAVHHLRFTTA